MRPPSSRFFAASIGIALLLAGCTVGSDGTRSAPGGPSSTTPAVSPTGSPTAAGPSRTPDAGTATSTVESVPAPLLVDTTSGRLRGKQTASARVFLGVRYGSSVAGEHRWTDADPAPRATGIVDATEQGPSCAQSSGVPGAKATESTSEDCLFLNVTTPLRQRADEKLPVMVWWHGGGYLSGSGAAYGAQRLADRGHVMVVTLNYRLGVFGYLSLPGLAGSGDFGLADQILGTRWAKQNAAAFGGDPDNITVFGESAGAMSACALLASPGAAGLVDKIALSSGACTMKWPTGGLAPGDPAQHPYLALPAAEQLGISQARTLGCTGSRIAACLRDQPVSKLLTIFTEFSNVLAYGTPLLPENPATAIDHSVSTGIAVLSGGNQHEQAAFVAGIQAYHRTYTPSSYPRMLEEAFGTNARKVAAEYSLDRFPNAATAFATLITDSSWACPTLRGKLALARQGVTVHGYEFADPGSPNVNGVPTDEVAQGAAHATDVPYLFDIVDKNILRTAAQRRLGDQMVDYWSSFARTGTPRSDHGPNWAPITGTTPGTLQLAPTVTTVDYGAEHRCDFWATVSF